MKCQTDDDLALCFINNSDGFDKYLKYLVGNVQAEILLTNPMVQDFYNVSRMLKNSMSNLCEMLPLLMHQDLY